MFAKRTNWNLEENPYARAVRRHRENGRPLLDLTISNGKVIKAGNQFGVGMKK